jgi:ATP-dependent DNA helicase DinG
MHAMRRRIEEIFGPDGLLRLRLDHYEFRPQQLEMAKVVDDALARRSRAVVEAGTGTGKTLAYLIPAVLSGKKVMVSTATKNLQEQIFYKDIPFLRELGFDIEAAYLKGRSNYLCLYRFQDFARQPAFRSLADARHFPAIERWAARTETGDRAEIEGLPDDYPTWVDLSTTSDGCLGQRCPLFDECFVTRVRRQAAKADVVVVNHHLFFADVSVRASTHVAEVLPKADAVIFDEAHNLEEAASSFFGRQVSRWRFRDLATDIQRALHDVSRPPEELSGDVDRLVGEADLLFEVLGLRVPGRERQALSEEDCRRPEVVAAREVVEGTLHRVQHGVATCTPLGEVAEAFDRRAGELAYDLAFILDRVASDWVYLIERRGRRDTIFIQASPIDLAPFFTELLYPSQPCTIFTSATLAVDGQFHYFRSRIALGPDEPVAELQLEPAFDYMEQSLLYVPADLPEPSAPDFVDRITPTIAELVRLTQGRAFVLFTSYRNLRGVEERLAGQVDYPLLVQGERSRSALLEAFRAEPSVLLATSSFWEGVDVQGEALSLVIIDKLPFASPTDPVLRARIDYVREQGGDPFRNFQLPQAAIALKQGFGRLIRHRDDHGIVAILDRRLLERAYGTVFLATLPRARRTRDLAVVRRWWERKQASAGGH